MSIMSVEELQTALQSATQRCEAQRTALRTLYTELQEHTTKFDAIYIPPPRSLDLLHTISAALSNTSAVPSSTVRQQGRTQYSQNVGTPLPESLNKDSNVNNEEGNAAPRPRAGEAGLVPSASHRSSSQLSCPHSAAAAGAPQQQQQQPRPSTSSRRSLSLTSSLNGLHGQSQAAPGTTQLRNNEPPRSASQRSASQRSVAHSSSYGGVIQPRPAQQEQRVQQPSSTHASSSAGIHPISPWIINSEASQAQEEEKPVSRVAGLPQQQQQQQLSSVKTQDSLAESKKGEEEAEFVVPSIVKSSRDEAREAVAAEMQAYDDARRQEEEEEHKAVQNNENQRAGTPLRKYTATTKNNNNVSSTGSVNSSANPSATLHTANSNTSLSARPPSRHDGKLPSESTRPREPTCPSGAEEEARQFHTQPVIGSSSTPQERRMDSHPAIHSASTPAFYVAGTDEASEAAAQKARAAAAMQAVLNNNNIATVEPQHAEEEEEEGRNSPVRSLVDRSNEKLRPIQPGRQSSHASQKVSVHQTPSQQGALQPVGIPSSYQNHPASAQSVQQQEEAENREPVAPNAAHVSSRSHSARSNGLNSTSNVSGGPRTTAAATQGGSADLSTPRRKRPISPVRRPREPGLTHHHGSQILVPAANETGATPKNINNNNSSAAAGVKQASPLPHSGTSPDVGPRAPALRSTPSSHASPNSQQLTVTKAQKDNSQPLSTRLVTQPPSAHALRTATPRRCVASGLDSGQIEKALYGGRVLQTGWPSHVVEDAPGVREFMEAEAERLQQREERDREARSPSLALLQQQQRHLAEQRSTSVGGNGRPRLSSGALIPVEDALQVTRAPPPSLTERQLLLERAQLANQLDKMFKEMVITMRRYDETGLEARYAQLNQRIARVQDDLKRVETEINVVQNLERKAQRRTISPF